jgi:hypothetical protein
VLKYKYLRKNLVDDWVLFFNGDDNFELVENQNETSDEDLKRIFLEGFIDG